MDCELRIHVGRGIDPHFGRDPNSTYLESQYLPILVDQYVSLNWKNKFRLMWPSISQVSRRIFVCDNPHDHFLWRAEDGVDRQEFPPEEVSWSKLRISSSKIESQEVPILFSNVEEFLPYFLVVFPHRGTSDLYKLFE